MKIVRKLTLHRETLRTLSAAQLREAAAGVATRLGSCSPCPSISYCYACISVPEATCITD